MPMSLICYPIKIKIRSFERFNYTVLYHFMEKGMVDDMLQQRMNELLHYMNM